jgi:hypothetical protein
VQHARGSGSFCETPAEGGSVALGLRPVGCVSSQQSQIVRKRERGPDLTWLCREGRGDPNASSREWSPGAGRAMLPCMAPEREETDGESASSSLDLFPGRVFPRDWTSAFHQAPEARRVLRGRRRIVGAALIRRSQANRPPCFSRLLRGDLRLLRTRDWESGVGQHRAHAFNLTVVEPFEPPQAIELSETNALLGETKWPAIFHTNTDPTIFVHLKWPVESIATPNTVVGGRPVPQRYVK